MADIWLANEAGDMFEGHFDKNLWVRLNADIEKVRFLGAKAPLGIASVRK